MNPVRVLPLWTALVLASASCIDYKERKKERAAVMQERQAARATQKRGSGKAATQLLRGVNRAAGEATTKTEAPFVELHGYIVRGTDESSFRRCGSSRVYYTRLAPPAAAQVVQRYRFRAAALFSPVYFAVMGRMVDDTVTVGEHTYTAVVEISDILADKSEGAPECAPPPRGSMIAGR